MSLSLIRTLRVSPARWNQGPPNQPRLSGMVSHSMLEPTEAASTNASRYAGLYVNSVPVELLFAVKLPVL